MPFLCVVLRWNFPWSDFSECQHLYRFQEPNLLNFELKPSLINTVHLGWGFFVKIRLLKILIVTLTIFLFLHRFNLPFFGPISFFVCDNCRNNLSWHETKTKIVRKSKFLFQCNVSQVPSCLLLFIGRPSTAVLRNLY